ncbi:LIM and senescent cell antigen-like-containing domain protein 2 [Balamuthia mandrillaris]
MTSLDSLTAELDSLMQDIGGQTAGQGGSAFSMNELDDLLGSINQPPSSAGAGLTASGGATAILSTGPGQGFVSTGPGPRASTGPGAGFVSTGPGPISTGPGFVSTGPGPRVSTGPGAGFVSTGPGPRVSTGPGAGFVSTGPGPISTGPGLASTGPGAAFVRPQHAGRGGGNIGGVAEFTPEGKKLTVHGPPCDYCGEPVVGKVTNALGKHYHPEHFVCTNCSQPFPGGKFLEYEGKPYCEPHYYELFAPRCIACEQPIKEKVVKALGHFFHPEHFVCTGCGVSLVGKKYKEAGGEPYCDVCKAALQVEVDPKIHICGRCKKPIIGEYVTLNGQRMHPEHFRCEACGKEFTNGDCHEHMGKLYCKEDWDKLQLDICAGCRKPITGRSMTAMGRIWHPEHFCCAHCHTPFSGSQFYEHDNLPYCEVHYKILFGRLCAKCNKPVTHGAVEALGKIWHKEHFACQTCDTPLSVGSKICAWEGKPLCKKCYLKLPNEIRKKLEKKDKMEAKMEKARQRKEKREQKLLDKEEKKSLKKGKDIDGKDVFN